MAFSNLNQVDKEDKYTPSTTLTLSQLGGLGKVRDELQECVELPIAHPEIFIELGIQPGRGVLLHGPPGCGKTTIANALANEIGVPFLSISAPSVVSGMSGESEKKIRELFEEAKSLAPCIMFIDEIDAITPKRDNAQREMERRIVAQLLTSMDGLSLENTGGKAVIIIGATNRPDSLDSALRRTGRFDKEISINVPDELAREDILQKTARNMKISGEIDFKKLAKMTPGYVAADLQSLSTAAGIMSMKRLFRDGKILELPLSNEMEIEVENENENENGNENGNEMDIDVETSNQSAISKFLKKYPEPLTEYQRSFISVNLDDFISALPTIQPTAKREGFATIPDVTWADIGALKSIRKELQISMVLPIQEPEEFSKVGINAPGGVLLWGPPGCGKTLLAKAVANESKANFISVKGPELINKYVGESERAIRQVFQRARASKPCIVFFDELDSLVPRRDGSLNESTSRVVNTLLTELDGLEDRKGVYVIAATNRPDIIDPAMLRPGRLDKLLYIELPTPDERKEILIKASRKSPLDRNISLQTIAYDQKCHNFSGADITNLVREAAMASLKRRIFTRINIGDGNFSTIIHDNDNGNEKDETEQSLIIQSDFDEAFKNVKPSVSDKDRLKYLKLNKRMGWSKIPEVIEEDNNSNSNMS